MKTVHLDSVPREVLVVIAGLTAIWALVLTARRALARARMRRRFVRGAEGEREAAGILEAHGFAIEGAQVSAYYTLEVDGALLEVGVRADYIVSRDDKQWVAEVKTGRAATRLETPATRRQLLEYSHAFAVDGIVLVDADSRTVRTVAFDRAASAERVTWMPLLAIAAVVAGLVAMVALAG